MHQKRKTLTKAVSVIRASVRRFRTVTSRSAYDLVFVPREPSVIDPAVLERMVAKQRVPLIYGFNDPIGLSH